jgi:hypothetical protein
MEWRMKSQCYKFIPFAMQNPLMQTTTIHDSMTNRAVLPDRGEIARVPTFGTRSSCT